MPWIWNSGTPIRSRRTKGMLEDSNSSNTKLSEEEQVRRIHAHVNKLIKTGGNNKTNPSNAKSGLTLSIVVSWLTNSWKKDPASAQCPHCRGFYIPGLHRHAGTRFSWIRFVVTWPPWWKWRKWALMPFWNCLATCWRGPGCFSFPFNDPGWSWKCLWW